eukprot:4851676-Prymnesium_polylepis.1
MAPLEAAAVVAIKAELSKRHGRHHLPAVVVEKLVRFFTSRGESLADLSLDVDDDDVEAWEKLWAVVAEDAGVDTASDRLRVVQYLHARSRPSSGTTRDATGVANVAITALEANGVSISSEAAAAMQNALAIAEAGDEVDIARWKREKAALVGTQNGTVNVCMFDSYIKLASKSSSITLERALKSDELWAQKKLKMAE